VESYFSSSQDRFWTKTPPIRPTEAREADPVPSDETELSDRPLPSWMDFSSQAAEPRIRFKSKTLIYV
jgi:hypothetical protein